MKYPTKYTYVEFTYTNESGKEVNAKHEIIGRYTKDKVLQALKSMYNDSVKLILRDFRRKNRKKSN